MRAQFIHGQSSKESLGVGLYKLEICIDFEFYRINTDIDRMWDYMDVIWAIVQEEDPNAELLHRGYRILDDSRAPGEKDYVGQLFCRLMTPKDLWEFINYIENFEWEEGKLRDILKINIYNRIVWDKYHNYWWANKNFKNEPFER